ncbi:hypothetical protein [Mycobacterium neglectum]|uniref:hypothetical protein n=1 Tax=Mycobacterium neglectum TaxID=242737 RepID=UPI001FE6B714|nr:hypothetical protein [Mycobacterium neglectum]
MEFEVVDLTSWIRGEREPGGDEEKRWFGAPVEAPFEGHWLFKPRRVVELALSKERQDRGDRPDVLVRGEDWAEKISYELARLIGLPAATTELAQTTRRSDATLATGSMSRDVRPKHWQLSPGAALLDEVDPEFDARSCRGHTLDAIRNALLGARGPVNSVFDTWTGFDVFAGYLVFDAWIANTDRHAHNWAVLQSPDVGTVHLAHSFDHGSALGSGDGDDRRARTLAGGVERWCLRGCASSFEVPRATTLVSLAQQSLEIASPAAREHWMNQISQVEQSACDDIVARIPNLSESTRRFVIDVLSINRRRLLDAT